VKKFAYLIPAVLALAACSAPSTNTATSTTTVPASTTTTTSTAAAGKTWTYRELQAIAEKLGYSYNTVEFAESNMLMYVNAGNIVTENWQFHLSKDSDRALRKSLCDAGMARRDGIILTNGSTLVVYPGLDAMSDLDGFAKKFAAARITGLRPEPNCPK
jgi:hypothetical protein